MSSLNNSNNSNEIKHEYQNDEDRPVFIVAVGPHGCGKSKTQSMIINNFSLNIEEKDINVYSINKVIEENEDYRKFVEVLYDLYLNKTLLQKYIPKKDKKDWDKFFDFFLNYQKYVNKGYMGPKKFEEFKKIGLTNNPIIKMFRKDCKYIYYGIRGSRYTDAIDDKSLKKLNAPRFDIFDKYGDRYILQILNYFNTINQKKEIIQFLIDEINKKYNIAKKNTKKNNLNSKNSKNSKNRKNSKNSKKSKAIGNERYVMLKNRKYIDLPYYNHIKDIKISLKKKNNIMIENLGDTFESHGEAIPSLRWILEKYGETLIKYNYQLILSIPFISSIEEIKQRNLAKFFNSYILYIKDKDKNTPPRFPNIGDNYSCKIKRIYDNFRITVKYFENRINKKKCDLIEKNVKKCFNSAIFGKKFMNINFSFILFYSRLDVNKIIKFDSNNIDDVIKLMKKQYSKEIPFYDEHFVCSQRREHPKLCLKKDKKNKTIKCSIESKRFF